MSKTQLEVTKHLLFEEGGLLVANIKLFPGSSRDAPPERVGEQINLAIAQIEADDYDEVNTED